MYDSYIGEIRILSSIFVPAGWLLCDGMEYPVSGYDALSEVIGYTYGGNGYSTFAVPNLTGRAPMGPGRGAGLTPRKLGEVGGEENVTLRVSEMARHRHNLQCVPGSPDTIANTFNPASALFSTGKEIPFYYDKEGPLEPMASSLLGSFGGDQSHANIQPYLVMNYIISWYGTIPIETGEEGASE